MSTLSKSTTPKPFVFAVLCAVGVTLAGCDKGSSTPPPTSPKLDQIVPTQPADPKKPSLPAPKDPADTKK